MSGQRPSAGGAYKPVTVKPRYKDTGYKDILTYKDTFLGPAGINFAVLHTSL